MANSSSVAGSSSCSRRRNFVRVVVAKGFLHSLEVHLETSSCIAIQSLRIEDERVSLVRGAEGYSRRLRLTEFEGLLPRLQSEAQLVLCHHVLQSLRATLVVPNFEKERVDHDTACKRAVPECLSLEQIVMRLHESHNRQTLHLLGPCGIVRYLEQEAAPETHKWGRRRPGEEKAGGGGRGRSTSTDTGSATPSWEGGSRQEWRAPNPWP
ncbi:hypothetical protein HYQ46_007285 [Verticillium longisporum]|nr:hypothetical protein HYQ46_007285 [Verticillium longisporum]